MFAFMCVTNDQKVSYIKKHVIKHIKSNGLSVNNENLYWSYKGLLDAWLEDDEFNDKKIAWIIALQSEILKIGKTLTPEQKDPNK